MQKIIVIGCPGSGKSYFSKELNRITAIPLFHLDMMFWNADRTTVEKEVFTERLSNALNKSKWIIDGNYSATMELRLTHCDTVFFLDYPLETCLKGIEERKGKHRSDMPWIEDDKNEDLEFLEFIKNFNSESRPKIIKLLESFPYKEIHIFQSRKEADDFLKSLEQSF